MLTQLIIENLALVKKVALRLEPGMTVLTGETGAGKSVIVTALALALGSRGERDFVRHGSDGLRVEAHFNHHPSPPPGPDDDNSDNHDDFVVGRTVSAAGKSTITIDGQRSSLGRLRSISESLGEILGQHANQRLMKEENHLGFLDEYAGLGSQVEAVSETFRKWHKAVHELSRVTTRREQLEHERELLLFQRAEIDKAAIEIGEEEKLRAEQKILDAARTLMSSAALTNNLLDGDGTSILDLVRQARTETDRMAQIDPDLSASASELYEIQIRLEEFRSEIEQYGTRIVDDPARIEQINLRLDEIYNLKKKYGGSEESILTTLDAIAAKLQDNPNTTALIAELQTQVEKARTAYSKLALALSKMRRAAATKLQRKVVAELTDLAIDAARFEFQFVDEDDEDGVVINGRAVKPTETGLEEAVIMFSANPGEPLRSLVKTASGGEMSRVLLALKAAGLSADGTSPLLVFDEVDAGIGGRTADQVAAKLSQLARSSQLVVVTHLHQIARRADHHFAIRKQSGPDKRQVISIERLQGTAVDAELDRMIGLPQKSE
jgi:DNA repair protein RecN (Recombination protein N)